MAGKEMEDLDRIRKLRSQARSSITRTVNDLKTLLTTTPLPREQLKQTLTVLETKWATLKEKDREVQGVIPEELIESECNSCDQYLESVTAIKFQVCSALDSTTASRSLAPASDGVNATGPRRSSSGDRSRSTGVTLPKLRIDTFSGDLSKWQGFWDQFRASIHENERLTDVNKLKYLVSLVSGPAARAIEGLSISDENYTTAVDILQKRFGKDDLLVTENMGRLFELRTVRSSTDVKGLRELHETVTVRIRNLESLNVTTAQYAIPLRQVILKKIPRDLEMDFYRTKDKGKDTNGDSLSSLLDFLENEIECRERARREADDVPKRREPTPASASSLTATASSVSDPASAMAAPSTPTCVLCKSGQHRLEGCTAGLSPEEVRLILRLEGRCFLCGRRSHISKDCRVRRVLQCDRCHRRHLTQLCPGVNSSSTEQSPQSSQSTAQEPSTVHASTGTVVTSLSSSSAVLPGAAVLLQTAKVWIEGTDGRRSLARILLDGGSQRSFIRQDVSTKLGCTLLRSEDLHVGALGNTASSCTKYRCVRVLLRSQFSASCMAIEAVEYPDICSDGLPVLDSHSAQHVKNMGLQLADEPSSPTDISLLIGADFYWGVVTGATARLSDYLVAVETLFGWTIQGSGRNASGGHCRIPSVHVLHVEVHQEDTNVIDQQLSAFWELEHLGITDRHQSDSDGDTVLRKFRSTAQLLNGRYTVPLPWKSEAPEALGDNKKLAVQRLDSTIKRLRRDQTLLEEYDSTIRQYLRLQHAERVLQPELVAGPLYYMPHHAVIRRDRETTKVRIVFDASSKAHGSLSLNEALHAGPNLNPDVLQLLLRFRSYHVALTADIEKAFLQIVLDSANRDCLRFLWYATTPRAGEPLPPVEIWRMTRVPFGAKSSPFLLAATIRHHLRAAEETYPRTASLLSSHFYVDDLVVGMPSPEEALTVYHESRQIFRDAGMKLVKWTSNDAHLRATFDADGTGSSTTSPLRKVLGIVWDIETDEIRYPLKSMSEFLEQRSNTKRYVLQAVARIYDPLGDVAPFVLTAKILLQRIWLSKMSWDEELPDLT
ncbi:uncharacterized protein LOC135375756 [Ornithodoros turicata]|uniref:uncharacterized protein LOC135375756 n=1 Tax=Ornithodoros turicata TaxID=34597 RepID=UPI0031392453